MAAAGTRSVQGVRFSDGLPEEVIATMTAAMEFRAFPAGEVIIRQGEPGGRLYVLTEGRAEARITTDGGSAVDAATFAPGDCFGEMSLFTGDGASADVVAVTDVATLTADREVMNGLLADEPCLLTAFVRVVSSRLRATNVTLGVAEERAEQLAQFLQGLEADQAAELIGRDPATKEVLRQIEREAAQDEPLLIEGEPGTGKDYVARLVHFDSARREMPLLKVECADLHADEWGDPLFGPANHGGAPAHRSAMCHLELARGGTLLLCNVDALPPTVQERLARYLTCAEVGNGDAPTVRILATCRRGLREVAEGGHFSPRLAALLTAHLIRVPPLRERRRDIPDLAQHFLEKHAARLGRPVEQFDDQAVNKLVTHDYLHGNVRELEEAVERAVLLAEDDTVQAEEIFLGPPATTLPRGLNLLRLPQPVVQLLLRFHPGMTRVLVAAFFAFVLLECFFRPHPSDSHLGTFLAWRLWWPALVCSLFLVGRSWCSVCPMAFAGGSVQRKYGRDLRIPAWIKDKTLWVIGAGFFGIVWVEEVTGMRAGPRATGWLLLTIMAGAVVASVLYPRRTWCRHLCPLGGFAGACSTSSLLELRPTIDVCVAKCKGHACYKGTDEVPGCPMFQHVMFVDSNQDCIMCLNCVRNCPNDSPQLNLRLPARELWEGEGPRPEMGWFVALLLGMLPPLSLLQRWELSQAAGTTLLHSHRFGVVTALLLLGAAVPLLWLALVVRRATRGDDTTAARRILQRVAAWLPMVGAGFTCYQLNFAPALGNLRTAFLYQVPGAAASAGVAFSALAVIQFVMLVLGLTLTVIALWAAQRREELQPKQRWLSRAAVDLGACVTYWVVVLMLMVHWRGQVG